MRTDLSHLPPSTPEEIRAMTRRAGLDLPEELMQQFIAAWPAFEAMVWRIPRNLDRAAGTQLPAAAHRAELTAFGGAPGSRAVTRVLLI